MVVTTIIALSALASPSVSTATVGVPRPTIVGIVRGGEDVSPPPGSLLRAYDPVVTGPDGWAEIEILDRGRLRVFPRTRVEVGVGPTLLVASGRAWLDAYRWTAMVLRRERGLAGPGTSVILEDTQSAGLAVVVRSGSVRIGPVGELDVRTGAVWRLPPVGPARLAQPGGHQLADLLRQQVDDVVGDWSGLDDWLDAVLDLVILAPAQGLDDASVMRAEQEATGRSSSGLLVESALRPPPFFEDEVPPRGPNVRVEVEFSED